MCVLQAAARNQRVSELLLCVFHGGKIQNCLICSIISIILKLFLVLKPRDKFTSLIHGKNESEKFFFKSSGKYGNLYGKKY